MKYTEEDEKKFYDLMNRKREEVSGMNVEEKERKRLYGILDEAIERYEDTKANYLKNMKLVGKV